MNYSSWVKKHSLAHKRIVQKLIAKKFNKEQIINYFDFDNMVKNELSFCPLYKENKQCHNMEFLNCYLCSCPNFRFKDKGIKEVGSATQFSFCSINSKNGKQEVYGNNIHQDCSRCSIPHHKEYVKKYFNLEWSKIMQSCIL